MDLKKLFVYVPAASEVTWAQTYLTEGVPNQKCIDDYGNKIVFLANSHRIVVKGNFYGTDPSDIQAIYDLIGGDNIADLKSALGISDSVATDFAHAIADAIAAAVNALDTASDITTASIADGIVTLTAGIKEENGIIAKGSGADITLAKVVTTGKAEDVSVTYAGFTTKTVEGALTQLHGADGVLQTNIDAAYANAEAYTDEKVGAEKTRAEGAEQELNNAYTAFKNKVGDIDSLSGTLKEYIDTQDKKGMTVVTTDAASGISVTAHEETDGHYTYTIHADQSIWEFMGSATAASVEAIPATLDAKYAEEGAKRDHAEVGDVWAVTVDSNTTLYACSKLKSDAEEYNTWTLIGSAQGISSVDPTSSHGVNLTNNASVVGVTVTPGSVAYDDASVITGGAAYTAIKTAQDNAYAYTKSVGDAIIDEYTTADSGIIKAYQNADAAIKKAMANSVVGNSEDASYLTVTDGGETADGHAYTINLNEIALQNYVVDNLWEEYRAPQS